MLDRNWLQRPFIMLGSQLYIKNWVAVVVFITIGHYL